jgi:hypothetical protein
LLAVLDLVVVVVLVVQRVTIQSAQITQEREAFMVAVVDQDMLLDLLVAVVV